MKFLEVVNKVHFRKLMKLLSCFLKGIWAGKQVSVSTDLSAC